MFRSLIIASLVYVYGHPHFDGSRPDALNMPVQAFHMEVNAAATDSSRALALLNDFRTGQYMNKISESLKKVI